MFLPTTKSASFCRACAVVVVVVLGVATPEVASVSDHVTGSVDVWKPRSPGEVRCFCNLPQCVTSGYMCKSLRGGCFSDLSDLHDVTKARHGCWELLDSDQQGQCQMEPGSRQAHPRSLLVCCRSDMCNHVDSPEVRHRVEETSLARIHNASAYPLTPNISGGNTNTEVWFKAATIAVPICGAIILFALIALAVRILRGDAADADLMTRKEAVGLSTSKHREAFGACPKKQPLLAKCGCVVDGSAAERYDKRTLGFCEKGRGADV